MRGVVHAFGWSLLAVGLVASASAADDDPVAVQKQAADEVWKKVTGKAAPAQVETDHLLLYGSVSKEDLRSLGQVAERILRGVRRRLKVDPEEESWPGKLIVHAFDRRAQLTSFIRRVLRRSPESDERGGYAHEREYSYVVVGPAAGESGLQVLELELVQQVAAAVLTKKKVGRLPGWFVDGFARAVAQRYAPMAFSRHRALVRALVRQGKTAEDIWSGNLAAEEGRVLNASFLDYLVNDRRLGRRFLDIVDSCRDGTPFEDTLKAVRLNPKLVAYGWRVWAARGR